MPLILQGAPTFDLSILLCLGKGGKLKRSRLIRRTARREGLLDNPLALSSVNKRKQKAVGLGKKKTGGRLLW